jgi:type I restriction-modification system DNA methylase subunit
MPRPVTWLLLTNFAQLHFIRVNEESPTFSFQLNELEKRADELWELLAPERLEADRIEELYDQEQKADLDQRFLVDLKQWRLILSNGFGIRNQKASLAELTSASQQLLDRFLFCRMLETHGLIEYNKLARAFVGYETFFGQHSRKTFAEFLRESLFGEIRDKFNTELFVQPQLCDTLEIDNAFLAAVIGHTPLPAEVALTCGIEQGQGQLFTFRHLYSYDFSRMSHDIMGAVYERFLAHKLEEKNGRITIEETDALRKKEGIYYTPRYIVDYLIAHTLGEQAGPIVDAAIALLQEKKYRDAHARIRELSQIKVLDPAMGSGSFLLRAFDHLLDCYRRYNRACRDIKQTGRIRETPGELFGERYEVAEEVLNPGFIIPVENIFGVDLDPQAVELARLNLWMRLMIAERDKIREELRTKRSNGALSLLPPLAENLKRGNSLISDPAIAGDAAFVWEKEFPNIMNRGGFDVVVGNPPYVLLQDEYRNEKELDYLRSNSRVASYKVDTYHLFIERGIELLRPVGRFGMITPSNFLTNNYLDVLRRFIVNESTIDHIVVIDGRVFMRVSVDTCLILLAAGSPTTGLFKILHAVPRLQMLQFTTEATISVENVLATKRALFTGDVASKAAGIFARIERNSVPLSEIVDVNFGKQLRDREEFESDVIEIGPDDEVPQGYKRCYTGEDVTRYYVGWGKLACLASEVARRGGCWDPAKQNAANKLLTRQVGRYPTFALDQRGYQCLNTIFMLTRRRKDSPEPAVLLGILNSKLIRAFWLARFYDQRRTFPKIKGSYLEMLPIKALSGSADKNIATGLEARVTAMVSAQDRLHAFASLLLQKIRHQHRTPCPLAHYLQKDYANALTFEILIEDVMQPGFVHKIDIESDNAALVLSAHVTTTMTEEPEVIPILRMHFAHVPLHQFMYACWQQFLADSARRKRWTTGKRPEEIYRRIVNTEEPLVFFHASATDNLRAITSLLESVAAEAGVSDLAALEAKIREADKKIDKLVYELYGLTDEEIAVVESASSKS